MNYHNIAESLLTFYNQHPHNLDVFINALLVQKGIRKSFIIQPINYKEPIGGPSQEWFNQAPITVSLLRDIQNTFPDLKFIHMNQGILIIRQDTKIPFDINNYTDTELGKLLSYPCPGDINNNRNFAVRYNVIFKDKIYELFTSICGQIYPSVKIIGHQIRNFIRILNMYLPEPIFFEMDIHPILSTDTIIEAVLNNQIDEQIKDEIANIFSNYDLQILNILQENQIINIFDPQYRQLLLYILLQFQVEEESPDELQVISNTTERTQVRKIIFQKQQDSIVDILTTVYGIYIDPKYLQEAYDFYF